MPQSQTDPLIEYHIRRVKYLLAPVVIITIYYAIFLYYVLAFQFISRQSEDFVRPSWVGPVVFHGACLFLLLVGAVVRTYYWRNAGATTHFVFLALATALFILTIAGGVYFWGGSHVSVFGSLLVAVVGLTVIVAETWWVRLIFGTLCLLLFTFLAIPTYHLHVFPVKGPFRPNSPYTGADVYNIFQTFASVTTIFIAFILAWKHAQDRTIFGVDAAVHTLRVRATHKQRTEMVQTSIKFVVDLRNKVLVGGGQVYSDCINELKKDLQNSGQSFSGQDVWCGEWSPATDDVIGETLRSLVENQALSETPSEIREAVNTIAREHLQKEKSRWFGFWKR